VAYTLLADWMSEAESADEPIPPPPAA